jgi:hypothetical protein
MNGRQSIGLGATALAAVAFCVPAPAQIERERTLFTTDVPITIGPRVIEAGTYRLVVVRRSDQRSVVEVTDPERKRVYVVALATPHPIRAEEEAPEAKFVYYPGAPGFPKALRTWFPSDSRMGQDIVYSSAQIRNLELALARQVTPPEQPEVMASAEPAAAPLPETPTTVAEFQPRPARPDRLPKTASPVPLAGLAGALSLAAAAFLNRSRT